VLVEEIIRVVGEQIHPHLAYLPGLADLIGRIGKYVQSWVREFYATVWIDPDHDYIEFSFLGVPRRIYSEEARTILRIPRHALLSLADLPNLHGCQTLSAADLRRVERYQYIVPRYNPTQLVRSVTRGTPARHSHIPEVPETVAEHDAVVRDIAETKLA
jgi:hypothetical protein